MNAYINHLRRWINNDEAVLKRQKEQFRKLTLPVAREKQANEKVSDHGSAPATLDCNSDVTALSVIAAPLGWASGRIVKIIVDTIALL